MDKEINKKARELVEKYLNADFNCKGCTTPYCDIPCTSLSLYDAKQCALISIQNTIDALSEYDKRTEEYLRKQFPNYFSFELQNMESDFRYYDKLKEAVTQL